MKKSLICIALMAVAAVALAMALPMFSDPAAAMFHYGDHLTTAMTLMVPLNQRARGIMGVRAGPENAKQVLEELQTTFAAFKEANEKELEGIKTKFADVVQTEKVDRINKDVEKLQTSMDEINTMIAALKVGGGSGDAPDPAKAEYGKAFNRFFRKGVDANLQELAVKASMSTDSDPDGGYVVPEEMESTIDRVLGTVSTMRSISRVMSISTDTYKKLVSVGGAGAGWVGEKEARPETDSAQLRELVFNAMELYANPAATQKLLDDAAVNIEQWLADEVAITFSELEGAAFISGDGVNKPRGILAYDTVIDTNYSWGKLGYRKTSVAAALSDGTNNGADALIDLIYALKQGYRGNARFLMNRKTTAAVRKLKTIGDTESYLWQPSVQVGEPATLLGYPTSDDDNMQDVGANAFPIAFGDFQRGYLIVDRVGIRVLRDPYTNKPYVHFYTTKRVGGGVQNFEAIKLLKCEA